MGELAADLTTGDMSVEGFTCLLVFKNLFSFGLTFKGFDWIVASEIKPLFMILGGVQVGICALSIPMCRFPSWHYFESGDANALVDILGKKNRSFFYRHNVFFKVTDWIADKIVAPFDKLSRKLGLYKLLGMED